LTYLLDELADCLPSLSPDVAEWVCQLDRLGREMELRRLELEKIELEQAEIELELDEIERDMQEISRQNALAEARRWERDYYIAVAAVTAACSS